MLSAKSPSKFQTEAKLRSSTTLKSRPNLSKPELQSSSQFIKPTSLRANISPSHIEPIKTDYYSNHVLSVRNPQIQSSNLRNNQTPLKMIDLRQKIGLHSPHKSLITGDTKRTIETSNRKTPSKEREIDMKPKLRLQLSAPKSRPPKKLSPLKSPVKERRGFFTNDTAQPSGETDTGSKKKPVNLFKAAAKRYLAAQRIIKTFESTISSSPAHKTLKTFEDENSSVNSGEDSTIIDPMQQNKENLFSMIQAIEDCITCRKSKTDIARYLEKVVELAQKTHNFELQISALKTQAKVLFLYNDLYRAISAFKTIKHLADFNRSFTAKLKAYKYLAMCYHKIHNYRMAIFYNIKMLQAAWLCESKRYELLAYDRIGINYYYLGSLEKAKYYHDKMATGIGEPLDSKLRELGINKLLQRLEGNAGVKKNFELNKVEDELNGYNVPASEDEFELPSPRNLSHINTELAGHEHDDSPGHGKKRKVFNVLNKMMNPHTRERKPAKSRPIASTIETKDANSLSITRSKTDIFAGSVTQQVLISHLSPNRLLHNFHPNDIQHIMNSYITRGTPGDEEEYSVLDAKSLEKVRKKLEKLKDNAQMALQKIIEMHNGRRKSKGIEKNRKLFILQG